MLIRKIDPRFVPNWPHLIETTVAIIAGTLLPYLAARDRRLLKPTSEKLRDGEIEIENEDEEDEEHVEMERIREMVQQWKAEAAREGRPLKLPTSKLSTTLSPYYLIHCYEKGKLIIIGVFNYSAVHVEKYLDSGVGHFRMLDDVHVFHHQGLASNGDDRSSRHLLGYCLLGVSRFSFFLKGKKNNSKLTEKCRY